MLSHNWYTDCLYRKYLNYICHTYYIYYTSACIYTLTNWRQQFQREHYVLFHLIFDVHLQKVPHVPHFPYARSLHLFRALSFSLSLALSLSLPLSLALFPPSHTLFFPHYFSRALSLSPSLCPSLSYVLSLYLLFSLSRSRCVSPHLLLCSSLALSLSFSLAHSLSLSRFPTLSLSTKIAGCAEDQEAVVENLGITEWRLLPVGLHKERERNWEGGSERESEGQRESEIERQHKELYIYKSILIIVYTYTRRCTTYVYTYVYTYVHSKRARVRDFVLVVNLWAGRLLAFESSVFIENGKWVSKGCGSYLIHPGKPLAFPSLWFE